jgi:hypothetical protein
VRAVDPAAGAARMTYLRRKGGTMRELNQTDDLPWSWLEQCQARLKELVDHDNPINPKEKIKALLDMSHRFIAVSRKMLKLAELAGNAAYAMNSPPEAQSEQDAPAQ